MGISRAHIWPGSPVVVGPAGDPSGRGANLGPGFCGALLFLASGSSSRGFYSRRIPSHDISRAYFYSRFLIFKVIAGTEGKEKSSRGLFVPYSIRTEGSSLGGMTPVGKDGVSPT